MGEHRARPFARRVWGCQAHSSRTARLRSTNLGPGDGSIAPSRGVPQARSAESHPCSHDTASAGLTSQRLDLGLDREDAIELCYNVAVTGWLQATLDLQIIDSGLGRTLARPPDGWSASTRSSDCRASRLYGPARQGRCPTSRPRLPTRARLCFPAPGDEPQSDMHLSYASPQLALHSGRRARRRRPSCTTRASRRTGLHPSLACRSSTATASSVTITRVHDRPIGRDPDRSTGPRARHRSASCPEPKPHRSASTGSARARARRRRQARRRRAAST